MPRAATSVQIRNLTSPLCKITQSAYHKLRHNWLIDWSLTALSAQIGYIVPIDKNIAVTKVKSTRKLTMLRVGNTYNK